MKFNLPNSKERIAVLGWTGSGKTLAGLWHLSNANFDTMPWIIIDYKTDEHINAIERARYISSKETPKHRGIYILQPDPEEDISDFLTRVWSQENTGVYIDEGYMMGENSDVERRFKTLLTQGRSKRIPMIVLSQRPVWITRFVFSESNYFQVFRLNDERDQKTVASFLPKDAYISVPEFHSIYYDVSKNKVTYLRPVPNEQTTLEKIDARLRPVTRVV